jgi:hypothetical protein
VQKTGQLNSQVLTWQPRTPLQQGPRLPDVLHADQRQPPRRQHLPRRHLLPAQRLSPGAVPTDFDTLNRFENFTRDTAVPQHRVRWNWFYDIPTGRGKQFLHNAPKWLDQVVGGWKLSGNGTVVSSWFALPTDNWDLHGNTDIQIYGTKYPITDCTQTPASATSKADERCYAGYLYFNGYISQKVINSYLPNGLRNGIYGLPADYKPALTPIVPWPEGGKSTDTNAGDYDTNVVYIKLNNGTTQRVSKDTFLHPWRNQYRLGPFNWNQDISLAKNFTINEKFTLRANVDVFNVFNLQGLNGPSSSTGIASLQNSYGGFGIRPRQLQLSARLQW